MRIWYLAGIVEEEEGREPKMYLDSANPAWVTAGVGHRIVTVGDAMALPFVTTGGGKAPVEWISQDFSVVHGATRGMIAERYSGLSRCFLMDEAIDHLLIADLRRFLAELRRNVAEFDVWPEPVQDATADMAFNLGIGGFMQYHKLLAAIDAKNYKVAAQECRRNGISQKRNDDTAHLFLSAWEV